MKKKNVIFKYLRDPTPTDRMKMRDTFKYLDRFMYLLGWLPPPENSRYVFGKFVKTFLFASLIYLHVGFAITYAQEFRNLTPGEFFTSVQAAINCPGAFIKSVITVYNIWRLAVLKDKIDKMNKRCVTDEEELTVHRTAKLGNMAYIGFLFSYLGFVVLSVSSALWKLKSPWRVYVPYFDWRTSTSSLLVATLFETICMLSAVLFNIINDSYPLIFCLIIRLNLTLLKKRIEILRSDPTKSEEKNYEELICCIEDHKRILDACDLIRPALSPIVFIQFLFVGLLFGLTMINLVFFANMSNGIASVSYFVGLIIQTFPFCYACTLIDTDCDDLSNTIFYSNWIDARQNYKTTLLYFLHNAQQNITFMAGAIFPISLTTNIHVAKFAFTVVTFVREMNIVDKLKAE